MIIFRGVPILSNLFTHILSIQYTRCYVFSCCVYSFVRFSCSRNLVGGCSSVDRQSHRPSSHWLLGNFCLSCLNLMLSAAHSQPVCLAPASTCAILFLFLFAAFPLLSFSISSFFLSKHIIAFYFDRRRSTNLAAIFISHRSIPLSTPLLPKSLMSSDQINLFLRSSAPRSSDAK